MIKKIFWIWTLMLLFGASVSAANLPAICKVSVPESCFDTDGVLKTEGDHCSSETESGFKGHTTLIEVLRHLKVSYVVDLKTRQGMESFQIELMNACGADGWDDNPGCVPEETILEKECTLEDFRSGKYDICTAEAVRRYIAWQKAETTQCDTRPSLEFKSLNEKLEEGALKFEVHAMYLDAIWGWENPTDFTVKDLTRVSSASDISIQGLNFFGQNMFLNEEPLTLTGTAPQEISGTFTSGDLFIETDTNALVVKKSGEKNFSVPLSAIKSDNFRIARLGGDANINCNNQLLPKYLIGAKCDTDPNDKDRGLYGDARDITYWLQKFSGQITSFIAAIAILVIGWNAFGIVFSAGDGDKIASKKQAIIWVGIGLLLTIFAYVIVKSIIALTF